MVKSPGRTSSTSLHSIGVETVPSRVAAHAVGRGDGVVARVLVVVDEQHCGVTVLAPPGGRHVVRCPSLDLAGEGQGGTTYVPEAVRRLDPHVDVHPLATTGLRPADRTQVVEHLVRDVGHAPYAAKSHSGIGSRSIRHSSGFSVSARRLFHGMELHRRHLHRPDHRAQLGDAELVGRAVVARERARAPSPPTGGAPWGSRFWWTFSPLTPVGKRCIMHGRSRSALTMPSPTREVVVDQVELGLTAAPGSRPGPGW